MIEKIDILQYSEGSHLSFHSGKETAWFLCIVAYHHEVVIQLRKDCLDSLPEAFICPCWRGPVLLVQPIWDIKGNLIQPTGIDRCYEENIVFLYTIDYNVGRSIFPDFL